MAKGSLPDSATETAVSAPSDPRKPRLETLHKRNLKQRREEIKSLMHKPPGWAFNSHSSLSSRARQPVPTSPRPVNAAGTAGSADHRRHFPHNTLNGAITRPLPRPDIITPFSARSSEAA
ncbi:hypothetical protein MHYP_G00252470 [Metynnis hypsauchen]